MPAASTALCQEGIKSTSAYRFGAAILYDQQLQAELSEFAPMIIGRHLGDYGQSLFQRRQMARGKCCRRPLTDSTLTAGRMIIAGNCDRASAGRRRRCAAADLKTEGTTAGRQTGKIAIRK
jgi:hypothetical protein